jgi:hypothetical protein
MPAGPRGPLTKPFEQQSREDLWAGIVLPFIWLLMPILIVAMTFSPGMTARSQWGLWLVRGAISVVCGGIVFAMVFPRIRELRRRSRVRQ